MTDNPNRVFEEPEYEDGSPVPRTAGDWQRLSTRLQERRNRIRPILETKGIDPMDDPSYAHLLGELGLAERLAQGLDASTTEFTVPDNLEDL